MAKKTFQPSSKSSTALYGSGSHKFIMSAITIILIYCIYNYLRGLENCDCVNQQLVDRIKNIELFLLVVMTLGLVVSVYYGNTAVGQLTGFFIANPAMMYIVGLYMLFIIGIESYLVYEVYNLRKTLPKNCECADKWQLNLLYGQCVWYAIVIAMFMFSLLAAIMMNMI